MSNAAEMDAQEIINYIATAPKKTPVKLYVREKPGMKVQWGNAHVYGGRRGKTVFGDWDELKAILDANADSIDYYDVENDCRNSAVPMLDLKGINARIEPGAIIRDRVEIGDRAVIMMGAIINIGSVIGEGSMIDMGAVLGGGDALQCPDGDQPFIGRFPDLVAALRGRGLRARRKGLQSLCRACAEVMVAL